MKYIELRARSAFSFLEGSALPEDLVERAAELGYPAIAMGDRDGLYGAPRFYHGAERAGIRAIVGAELTLDLSSDLVFRPVFDRCAVQPRSGDQRLYVLVPDRERYRNLCRMITASKMRPLNPVEIEQGRVPQYPAKGESRITLDDLERYGAGLICLAGGARSPLALALTRGDDPRALCDRLGAIFGRGNFYIDLGRHLDPAEERLNRRLAALAAASGVPLVATNDVCHTGADRALLDALTCIRLGLTLEEAGRALWANAERRLKPAAEMAALFRDLPGAVAATGAIAERCAFKLCDLGYRFPSYPLPPGETPDSYLRLLVEAGSARAMGRGARRAGARPARARARNNRAAWACRLLPHRLGHRAVLPRERDHGAGARLGGQQRGLLRARNHGGRRGQDGTVCSSAFSPRSAANGRTSISICRAATSARRSSSTSIAATESAAPR